MNQKSLKLRGLYRSYNDLTSVPDGALLTAQNIDIAITDIGQIRKGYDALDASYSAAADRTDKLWFYDGTLFSHNGTYKSADTISRFVEGVAEVTTITVPDTASASQADYFMLYNKDGVSFALWLDIDGDGTAPTGANYLAADQQIEIDIATGNTAVFNAQLVKAQMTSLLFLDVVNNGDGTITITQQKTGATTNAAAYSEDDGGAGSFSVSVDIAGSDASWQTVRSGSAPSGVGRRLEAVTTKSNCYMTTDQGIYVIESASGTPRLAGLPKPLAPAVSIPGAPATTWLADGKVVGYQVVIGYKDSNGNLYLSEPSETVVIENKTGSAGEVTLVIPIPGEIQTNTGNGFEYFVQVYRTKIVDSGVTPSAEYFLVYEKAHTSGTSETITDQTPEALTGATLYTSPSQQGAALANTQPPLAKCLATFKRHVFFADTVSKHSYSFTLLGTYDAVGGYGGPSGLQEDDTITISDGTTTETYTAKASPASAKDFELVTPGSGSVATSTTIRDTAQNLVREINDESDLVYAYYVSPSDGKPGQIRLIAQSLGSDPFHVQSSRSTCWSPALPSSGTTEQSDNDEKQNGIGWTKLLEPEHAPLAYRTEVGSSDKAILAIVPLRDSLFIFKDGEGIYRLSGTNAANFEITQFDSSANLIGPNTVAVLNNQIWCLTDQGIATVTETQVSIRSLPIEEDIRQLLAQNLANVKEMAFGVSVESQRKYMLFVPESVGDTNPTLAYVFNTFTNAWTTYTLNATAGVEDEGKAYLGSAISNRVLVEQQNYTFRDYADFSFSSSISAITDLTLTISSGADEVSVGDVITQGDNVFSQVESVNPTGSTVTLVRDPGFQVGAIDVRKAISVEVEWVPFNGGEPAMNASFHTVTLNFKQDFSGTAYLDFTSDLSQATESVAIEGSGVAQWGLLPWGQFGWGDRGRRGPIRQWVPRAKQRSNELTVAFRLSYAYTDFRLAGITVFFEPGSDRSMV